MKVLILAGGYATRLWPLTQKRAKPLLLVDGKTILAHILDKIPSSYEVFILTNKKFEEDFKKEVQKLGRSKATIFCEDSLSDGEKLGALGAISLFLKDQKIEENILIFAGDNVLPRLCVSRLLCGSDQAHIAIRQVESLYEARKFGVVEVSEKLENNLFRVKTFEEKPESPRSKWVMTGFLSLGKNLLPLLHHYAEKSPDALGGIFVELLRQKKEIYADKVSGDWFDIGSFEMYLEAHKKLQSQEVLQGEKVQEKRNTFQGKVFLGEGSCIENCRITDSIIFPGCKLKNCHISQSVIDQNTHLEKVDINRKLIRQGTNLYG